MTTAPKDYVQHAACNVFVTGATGLLGNNLVRELLARGYSVKALVRSRAKGEQQFNDLPDVQLVIGDMADVGAFAALGGAAFGTRVDIDPVDLGQRPVDNCFGALTFC